MLLRGYIRRFMLIWVLIHLAGLSSAGAADAAAPSQRLATDKDFNDRILPMIEFYCLDCHTGGKSAGGAPFDRLKKPSQILEEREVWEDALKYIRIRGMPPQNYEERPTAAEFAELEAWLDGKLNHCDCTVVKDVGRKTIHRLNRSEYNNTVRDLLGVTFRPAEDFPSDDVGYGFSNMSDVLSLPPLLFEKYMNAAERIAAAAKLPAPPKDVPPARAAEKILEPLLSRAFRRPVTASEVTRHVRLVEAAVKRGESLDRALRVALQAILVSPHFLFRVEHDPGPGNPALVHSLTDHELASRLSYFLWSSMPDDELFRLAGQGKLNQPAVLDQQVGRMLKDPKSVALIENFISQWLNLGMLDEVVPDPKLFPTFTAEFRSDIIKETKLVAGRIIREDRSLLEFLDADYTFVNEGLARHYGMAGIKGKAMRLATLPAAQRAGVLTHASVLTLTSNPNRTSIVRRGNWIINNILGLELPDPPGDVPSLEDGAKQSGAKTLREQLALHRADAACASCHNIMDPLGLGLENLDAVGRWREKADGIPVDAGGTLPTGESFSGPVALISILKTRKREFITHLTRRALTYALGRGLELSDSCAVDPLVDEFLEKGFRFSALARGIVKSRPFRMRQGWAGE